MSQVDLQEKIFNDQKETQVILEKAKHKIQNTRKDIQQSIVESQKCYENYKKQVEEINANLGEKVQEVLEQHYFIQETKEE